MRLTYTLYEYDRKHRLKRKHPPEQSRSFVKAFLQQLYCMTSNLTQNVVDITNTSRTITSTGEVELTGGLSVAHAGLDCMDDQNATQIFNGVASLVLDGKPHAIESDEKGIVIGTSNTAVAVGDDNLVAPIAHGTGAGQMVHYGCWGLNYTVGATDASFDVERIFRNDSGGSITVAEIGMYCVSHSNGNPSATTVYSFCILRDVISPTVAVGDGEYFKVRYTITVSV